MSTAPPRRREAIRDQRIVRLEPLISPAELLGELPLSDAQADVVLRGREQINAILDGEDDRLMVVVGPCSVHDADASREYAGRLAAEVGRLRDDLCIAMRVYFEKPRTTIGWKGLINDPHLDGSSDVNAGLRMARRLLLDVLLGDPPLFPRHREVELSWEVLDPIEEFWRRQGQPEEYPAGGWGPPCAEAMMASTGRTWRRP